MNLFFFEFLYFAYFGWVRSLCGCSIVSIVLVSVFVLEKKTSIQHPLESDNSFCMKAAPTHTILFAFVIRFSPFLCFLFAFSHVYCFNYAPSNQLSIVYWVEFNAYDQASNNVASKHRTIHNTCTSFAYSERTIKWWRVPLQMRKKKWMKFNGKITDNWKSNSIMKIMKEEPVFREEWFLFCSNSDQFPFRLRFRNKKINFFQYSDY